MKKLLFFVLTAALMFGCKKNDNDTPCPVSGATLPTSSAENPIPSGSEVTIQGRGFTASSEIWLRAQTKADGDVQATVTGVTSTSITFTAPAVSGEQSILLRQDGGEWPLGKLYFAETSEILPKKLVKVIRTYEAPEDSETETTTQEFSYDESGRLVRIQEKDGQDDESVSTIEYAENQITIKEADMTTVLHLSNGRMMNSVEEESDYKYETEFSYGDNGYLAGFIGKSTDRATSTGTLTTDETGFLEKCSVLFEEEDGTLTLDFVPNTSVRNNLNLDLTYIGEVLVETDELAVIYGYLLGVCGKRTTCLPQQYNLTEAGETYTYKYDYVFDGQYISKIGIDYGKGEKTTLELFYEE